MAIKDCIQDFIESWKVYDKQNYNPSQVYPPWTKRFVDSGYYSVSLSVNAIENNWQEVHRWCEDQFGGRHYAWTGSVFWFETEKDANWFTLRWS
jgi:hypothetical protein